MKLQTKGYVHFLLSSDIEPDAAYDSDQDPAFEAVCHCTFDLDFDEYSDGEIEDEERSLLLEASENAACFQKFESLV